MAPVERMSSTSPVETESVPSAPVTWIVSMNTGQLGRPAVKFSLLAVVVFEHRTTAIRPEELVATAMLAPLPVRLTWIGTS